MSPGKSASIYQCVPTAALAAELSDERTVRDLLNDALEHLSGAGLEGR
jgi:hypothetical protein